MRAKRSRGSADLRKAIPRKAKTIWVRMGMEESRQMVTEMLAEGRGRQGRSGNT